MSSSLNLSGVFADAIADHLSIIVNLQRKKTHLNGRRLALPTACWQATKFYGAGTAAVHPTPSIWRLNW